MELKIILSQQSESIVMTYLELDIIRMFLKEISEGTI